MAQSESPPTKRIAATAVVRNGILIRTASPATRLEDRATRVVDTIDPAPGTRLPLTPSTASPGRRSVTLASPGTPRNMGRLRSLVGASFSDGLPRSGSWGDGRSLAAIAQTFGRLTRSRYSRRRRGGGAVRGGRPSALWGRRSCCQRHRYRIVASSSVCQPHFTTPTLTPRLRWVHRLPGQDRVEGVGVAH